MIYISSLAVVSLLFMKHMMSPAFLITGVAWVLVFFLLSSRYSKKWLDIPEKKYVRKLFVAGLVIRLIWVIFSYIFYTIQTGIPFEWGSSDALEYHEASVWFREIGWKATFSYLFSQSLADAGYPLYLTALYYITGPYVIPARIVKSLLGAWTAVLMYRLAKSNFGDEVGRMTGIFCCLSPNLVMYCGMHLKEIEMIFLTVAAIERADAVIRQKTLNIWSLVVMGLLVISLFFFRTVLGATMVFAIFTAVVFSSSKVVTSWNRTLLIVWGVMAVAVLAGGTISRETQKLWRDRSANQSAKRSYQVHKGYKWAEYATGTVMAPMMFVLPFSTMVDVDEQYNQQFISGGNYVRNFMGIFVIISMFSAFFKRKNWRDISMTIAFLVSYLAVICMSGFSNSERFLLPGLPFLLMFGAYGVSLVDGSNFKYVKMWYLLVPVMIVGWAMFKLGTRGIL